LKTESRNMFKYYYIRIMTTEDVPVLSCRAQYVQFGDPNGQNFKPLLEVVSCSEQDCEPGKSSESEDLNRTNASM